MTENEHIERAERIDAYLTRRLSRAELDQFKEKLNSDPEFAAEVEERRLIMLALREKALEGIFSQMEGEVAVSTGDIASDKSSGGKTITFKPYYWVAIAAGIALLLAFFLLLPSNNRISSQELFAEQFEPLNTSSLRSSSGELQDSQDSMRQDLLKFYAANQFSDFQSLATDALQQPAYRAQYQDETLLLLGVSYLEMASPDPVKALEVLGAISEEKTAIFESAKMYQALAHILLEDRVAAETILQSLGSSSTQQSKADTLLLRMKEWEVE